MADADSVSRDSATSAAKALRVLEYLGVRGGAPLAELADHTRLPKSTLLRLIGVLVDEGFVRRDGPGRYRVTAKAWRIGCGAVDYEYVSAHVLPVLRELVEQTSETVHYAVYEDGQSVYVEKVDGMHPIRAYSVVGGSSPAYASATGKALLAWQPLAEVERVAVAAERLTATTLVGLDPLLAELERVRSRGCSVNRGEWRAGVWGVASPVRGRVGDVVASIGISGPEARIATRLEEFEDAVRASAATVSTQFGFVPRPPAGEKAA